MSPLSISTRLQGMGAMCVHVVSVPYLKEMCIHPAISYPRCNALFVKSHCGNISERSQPPKLTQVTVAAPANVACLLHRYSLTSTCRPVLAQAILLNSYPYFLFWPQASLMMDSGGKLSHNKALRQLRNN